MCVCKNNLPDLGFQYTENFHVQRSLDDHTELQPLPLSVLVRTKKKLWLILLDSMIDREMMGS